MKKNLSKMLTAAVSMALLFGTMPAAAYAESEGTFSIVSDGTDGSEFVDVTDAVDETEVVDTGSTESEFTDVAPENVLTQANINLASLVTGVAAVNTAAEDPNVTGQSGAFDGALTLTFTAGDIYAALAEALWNGGTDGVTFGNNDEEGRNAISADLYFPDTVVLQEAAVSDDLASLGVTVKVNNDTHSAKMIFELKSADAASFLDQYEQDMSILADDDQGNQKMTEEGNVRADVISIPYSGDAGSGVQISDFADQITAATPDTGFEIVAGSQVVDILFEGAAPLVEAGEPDEAVIEETVSEESSVDAGTVSEMDLVDGGTSSEASNAIAGTESSAQGDLVDDSTPEEETVVSYGVSYAFLSGTEGMELPESVLELLPSDDTVFSEGDTATAVNPEPMTVDVMEGSWNFNGYQGGDSITISGDSQNMFVGVWTYTENVVYYGVNYSFVSGTEGMELPEDVLALLPDGGTQYVEGDSAEAVQPEAYEVEAVDGTWTFAGYQADAITVSSDSAQNTFVGTWNYTPAPTEEPTPTPTEEPTPTPTEAPANDAVDDPTPTPTEEPTPTPTEEPTPTPTEAPADDVIDDPTPTPTKKPTPTPTEAPVETFYVAYDFSAQDGTALPQEVFDTFPNDNNEYAEGTKVKAIAPLADEVLVDDGTWIFEGYQSNTLTVSKESNNTFYGIWRFEAAPTYTVSYAFTSATQGVKLSDVVYDVIPSDDNQYRSGSTVNAMQPGATEVAVSNGTWVFNGYDQNSAKITNADVTFTGSWTFNETVVENYHVYYKYVSGTDGFGIPTEIAALMPVDESVYENGDVIEPINPSAATLTLGNWIWTFAGYDAASKTIKDADVSFVGTWTCTKNIDPNETISLKLVKKWVDGSNAAGKRPDHIKVTLYKNGEKQQSFTCNAPSQNADTWTYSLPELLKYENGKEISWTVDEEAVEGYSKSIDGMVITNTYGTRTSGVTTGDSSPIALYIGIGCAALALIVILLVMGKKKKK